MEERVHVRLLDDLTGIEHGDLFAGFRDDAEVMRNHDDRGIVALAQIVHQIENLRLNGHVQRSRGFVGDEQARVVDERDGDHHALEHAARQVMRIILEDFRRTRNFDAVEHFKRRIVHLRTVHIRMKTQGFLNLFFDGIHRVKRGHRLLKNHGDLFAADFAHLRFGQGGQLADAAVLALKANGAARADGQREGEQAHN